jgi:hypothetical protein
MPPVAFDVRAVFVGEVEDVDTFMVALGDDEHESREWIELQRALFEDEQDEALGLDTYCLVRSGGPTVYGGVESCVLTQHSLHLRFDDESTKVLGTQSYALSLHLTDAAHGELSRGLKRVFADRLPSEWRLD